MLESIQDGARLAALRDLDLLDTAPEEEFDRFTRLATDLLGVPVSLVSLVDAERQFFKSQRGLSDELAKQRQTPLSHSFCQYAVATKQPLVVADAREEPLLSGNRATLELGVVAYAGMPLVLKNGQAVGALCAIDNRPRDWTPQDLRILSDLAAAVEGILQLRAALARESLYDRLTGLPNRTLLVANCDQLLMREREGHKLAAMCAGVDEFTQINQAFGTDRADAVLVAVGERLARSLRSTDVLGRLRGDIFTILAPNIPDEREALALAGRIRAALSAEPLELDGEPLSVSLTIGIAIGAAGARGADLITEAASAMRQAKRHHGRVGIAEEGWNEAAASHLRLRGALHGAVARNEIRAAFQPVVRLDSGRVAGYETLARWQHPELGNVSPSVFIPAAEASADILPLGEWILGQACSQLAAWASHRDLYVTVNVAPLQLAQANFLEIARRIIDRTGAPASRLVIEITEGVLLESGEVQLANLAGLRRLGVRVALDDFGTGYSALGYLRRFPIDIIKIDRSFVEGMETDRHAAALVHAIVAMGKGMELEIVAEGIETHGQRELLNLLGCQYGQGYLFSPPIPSSEAEPGHLY